MIFLDDALNERQSQSPTTFLGSTTRIEHILDVLAGYALARVFDIEVCMLGIASYHNVDASLAAHGIYSILGEILHHPLK